MDNSAILDISISETKAVLGNESLEDDLYLFDNFQDMPIPAKPYRLNFFILGLCLRGKAQYSVDTEECMIQKYDAIIINERQVIDSYMVSPDFNGIFILITRNFMKETIKEVHDIVSLFLFTRNHHVIRLESKESDMVKQYYYILKEKIIDKSNYFRKDLIRSLMLAMIYDLSNIIYRIQQISNKRQTRAESIFSDFLHLLEENFKNERRVSWYSDQLCITSKYLSETIKQVSKRTPNEWINNFVILEARVLLKNSTKSIKEIAQELNFPNQSFLGKYFKEHIGVSPSEYRKS